MPPAPHDTAGPTVIRTDEWVSLSRASTLLNVSITTVRKLIEKGELTVRRLPNSYPRVLASDLWKVADRYVSGPGASPRRGA